MSNATSLRTPTYRKHKGSGQAVVTLNGRDIYLGKYGTKASRDEYNRSIGEWLAKRPAVAGIAAGLPKSRAANYVEEGHHRPAPEPVGRPGTCPAVFSCRSTE
jgi:hypothetical protein